MPPSRQAVQADLREVVERFAERAGVRPGWGVALGTPGVTALALYRLAHALFLRGHTFLAAWISGVAARRSGIEIHPSARLGRRCLFLGAGIHVGAGVILGDDCLIEPGAKLLGEGVIGDRLHPTIGNRAHIEAGAVLTGDIFVGNDVRILANASVGRDVPDGALALGAPCRVLARSQGRPDPDARAIQAIAERIYHLEEQLQILIFNAQRQNPLAERWKTRQPEQYGPIGAVEQLIDGAGI